MFEIWDNYTDIYINTLSLQTRSVTKREQDMRAKDTANPAPMVMPLTQLFNVIHPTLVYTGNTYNFWYMQASGSVRKNVAPTSNIVITSSSDESDFVDLHPKRKR
jgi:hypothetical protein